MAQVAEELRGGAVLTRIHCCQDCSQRACYGTARTSNWTGMKVRLTARKPGVPIIALYPGWSSCKVARPAQAR